MYKLPIAVPPGKKFFIVQRYGPSNSVLNSPGPNGEPHFHHGIDIAFATEVEGYGVPVVCPVPNATVVGINFDGAMTSTSNTINLEWREADGRKFNMAAVHVSGVEKKAPYVEGAIIGYLGNAGLVSPKPTILNPYLGTHLHLGLQIDDYWVDPALYFDLTAAYVGEVVPDIRKMLPVHWAWSELANHMEDLTGDKFTWTLTTVT